MGPDELRRTLDQVRAGTLSVDEALGRLPAPGVADLGFALLFSKATDQHADRWREILALERQGFEVQRIALRGWDGELVDEQDQQERMRTRYVLLDGLSALLWALLRTLLVAHSRRRRRCCNIASTSAAP